MANSLDVKLNLPTDAELAAMFDAVPMLRRNDVLGPVTAAGAKVIQERAKQLAPRSTASDRKKRSAKQRASAAWDKVPLRDTIGMVTRKGQRIAFSIVGPKHPHGNKAYFNASRKGSRRHILWGRDVGRVKISIRNWIVQASDETKGQQLAAMKAALTKKVAEMFS